MSQLTNGKKVINPPSNKSKSTNHINSLPEEDINDIIMTINLNTTLLSQFISANSNSNQTIDTAAFEHTQGLIDSIISKIKENSKKHSAIEHIEHSIANYPAYINSQIEKENSKKKALIKELHLLAQREEKIKFETLQVRKKATFKKGENAILIITPSLKAVEMNNEIRSIEEINSKVNEMNFKEREEIQRLENQFELLANKFNSLIKRDESKLKDTSYDYNNYFETLENEIDALANEPKDNEKEDDFGLKTQKTIESGMITYTASNNDRGNSRNRKSSFMTKMFSLWNKSAFDINANRTVNVDIEHNSPNEVYPEYENERKKKVQYQIKIERYKELYSKYKQGKSNIETQTL